ncbi:MAG: class I SAM-dependent methyltransferase [Candidatus Kariarchaeaceae archaeon]
MRKEDKVRDYYNQYAPQYDAFYAEIQQQKFEACSSWLKDLRGWSVDLGGGTGLLSAWLGETLPTLDISFIMLRQGLMDKRIDTALCCDIAKLPLRKQALDRIYSFTAIQNLVDPPAVFPEIVRTMNKQAFVIITALSKSITEDELASWATKFGLSTDRISFPLEDIGFYISASSSSSGS